MVRMTLEGKDSVRSLQFDFGLRQAIIVHEGKPDFILDLLTPLNLGSSLLDSDELDEVEDVLHNDRSEQSPSETRVLKQLLAINGGMFVVEIIVGWIAQSTGLLSDSLDMFADAAVYTLSLMAVGKTLREKKRAAKLSGILQIGLALGVFFEVARRFLEGSQPEALLMVGTASVALISNISCLFLLARHRKGEVHMRASWIFSTNDVIVNAGVILAGILVYFTKSHLPDLLVGSIIAVVVLMGGIKIIKISK